jgi:hypothetical protein
VCILKVSTASVHSAFDVLDISTSDHGSLRACPSSDYWLRNVAAGYIRICKRRSDRFTMLAASCAIVDGVKSRNGEANLKLSLLVNIAQAIRAVLFASAIAAMFTCRRCITALIH